MSDHRLKKIKVWHIYSKMLFGNKNSLIWTNPENTTLNQRK